MPSLVAEAWSDQFLFETAVFLFLDPLLIVIFLSIKLERVKSVTFLARASLS